MKNKIFLFWSLFAAFCYLNAQNVVCRKEYIGGTEELYDKAKIYLSANTSEISKTEVYVTFEDGCLYMHSNFVNHGASYPTKMYLKLSKVDKTPIDELVLNMFYPSELIDAARADGIDLADNIEIQNNVKYILDYRFIEKVKDNLNTVIGEKANLMYVDNQGGKHKMLYCKSLKGKDELNYAIEYRENIYSYIENENIESILNDMDKKLFNESDCKLLFWGNNTETMNKINSDFSDIIIKTDNFSIGAIDLLLSKYKGKTLMFLGHIEEDEFVFEKNRLKLVDIENCCEKYGISFYPIGCKSSLISGEGPMDDFNSIYALNLLKEALKSNNWGEFLSKFASHKFKLMIDDESFKNSRYTEIKIVKTQKVPSSDGEYIYSSNNIVGKIRIPTNGISNGRYLYVLYGLCIIILLLIVLFIIMRLTQKNI